MTDEELGTMTQRHTRARDDVASAHKDRGVLLTEVERLRADAAQERAAVVAWLREQRAYGSDELLGQGFANVCGILSDAIERGEHRREGAK